MRWRMSIGHTEGMEQATTNLTLDFVWAGTVHAFAGRSYGQINASLYVGTEAIRLVLKFPELGYSDEVYDFGTGEAVDAYLATRFPKGYKAGLYEFGQKMTAIHTPEARRYVADTLFRSLCA